VTLGLLKNMRLIRRCAPRNGRRCVFSLFQAIGGISRQSQTLPWDFFNSPTFPSFIKKNEKDEKK